MEGPRPIRVAVNAVVVQDDAVLHVEFDDESGLHYNLPGGGVEAGETLEEALRREVMEESCLEVTVERLLLVLESVGSRNTNMINGEVVPWNELRFFFLCSPRPGSTARLPERPDPHERAVVWFPLNEFTQVNLLPRIADRLLEALRDPAWAPSVVANPSS